MIGERLILQRELFYDDQFGNHASFKVALLDAEDLIRARFAGSCEGVVEGLAGFNRCFKPINVGSIRVGEMILNLMAELHDGEAVLIGSVVDGGERDLRAGGNSKGIRAELKIC